MALAKWEVAVFHTWDGLSEVDLLVFLAFVMEFDNADCLELVGNLVDVKKRDDCTNWL